MEHTKHIIRAVLLLVMITAGSVVVRHFLIPETFGDHGHYRYASVAEHAAPDPVHGAPEACADCHEEETKARSGGTHSPVSCEVCHAPLTRHVENEQRVAAMPVNRSTELCAWCHRRLVARPRDFPQVVIPDHVIEQGEQMREGVCLECHDAHNPNE